MNLHEMPKRKAVKKKKRRGRGCGSGLEKTAGRGLNGQKSRPGGTLPANFEGGSLCLFRRIPKLGGFRNVNRKEYTPVNLDTLNRFDEDAEVSEETDA